MRRQADGPKAARAGRCAQRTGAAMARDPGGFRQRDVLAIHSGRRHPKVSYGPASPSLDKIVDCDDNSSGWASGLPNIVRPAYHDLAEGIGRPNSVERSY